MTTAFDDSFYLLGPPLPSTPWDLDDLGDPPAFEFAGGQGILSDNVSHVLQPLDSSGYLEDALEQWGDRCKRRRTLLFPHDGESASVDSGAFEDLVRGLWNFDADFLDPTGDAPSMLTAGKETQEPTFAEEQLSQLSSSTSSSRCKATTTEPDSPSPYVPIKEKKTTAETRRRVVYPFALVRASSLDGGFTLEDFNRRLLMRPSRPIRHPVGEFASLPCVSGGGPGLSGKAIVGLTRIITRGSGTITIIRTRG